MRRRRWAALHVSSALHILIIHLAFPALLSPPLHPAIHPWQPSYPYIHPSTHPSIHALPLCPKILHLPFIRHFLDPPVASKKVAVTLRGVLGRWKLITDLYYFFFTPQGWMLIIVYSSSPRAESYFPPIRNSWGYNRCDQVGVSTLYCTYSHRFNFRKSPFFGPAKRQAREFPLIQFN